MATSQLFVLSVKLKMLMFGKDAINSINIQGTYEPYHFQPFPKKLHIFLFKSTHAHNSAIGLFFFFSARFPLSRYIQKDPSVFFSTKQPELLSI